MTRIDILTERLKPVLESALNNLDENANFRTMQILYEKIANCNDKVMIFRQRYANRVDDAGERRLEITKCVMAMKIDVSDIGDAEKAADILFMGFKLVAKLIMRLSGDCDLQTLVDACAQLEIRC